MRQTTWTPDYFIAVILCYCTCADGLTDRHKKLHTWLRHGCLPTCKIYSRSLQGFLFPVCAKLRIKMFTRLLFFFFSGFFQQPTAYTPEPIFTGNTSNNAGPRKDVPFRG